MGDPSRELQGADNDRQGSDVKFFDDAPLVARGVFPGIEALGNEPTIGRSDDGGSAPLRGLSRATG
jgi:hypothetical protein